MGSGARSGSPAACEARIAQSVSARVWAVGSAHPSRGVAFRFQDLLRVFVGAPGAIPGSVVHGHYLVFQMAEVAVPRELFGGILKRIAGLRPPVAVRC